MAQPKMPAIYISKYNRFVDNIIGRINRILGKSYDPVQVKLQSLDNKSKKTKKTNTKPKKGKGKTKNAERRKHTSAMMTNKMGELVVSRGNQIEFNEPKLIESETREPAFILISKAGSEDFIKNITVTTSEIRSNPKRSGTKNKKKNGTKSSTTNKNKTGTKTKNKTKATQTTKKSKPVARATLFGLSSIRRDGDVTVNMQSDHTTVKTNFVLGPLTLRVEREIGKGARRELKSATATTAEMYGRLNLRIIHGGTASLHSIRVLQPKQRPRTLKWHVTPERNTPGTKNRERKPKGDLRVVENHPWLTFDKLKSVVTSTANGVGGLIVHIQKDSLYSTSNRNYMGNVPTQLRI